MQTGSSLPVGRPCSRCRAVVLAAALPAAGAWALPPVELADVVAGSGGGSGGFVITGIDAGDLSGRCVSGAGDASGDGLDDVSVGAYQADPGGVDAVGESYVVFSPACRWDCDGSNDAIVGVTDLLAMLAQYDPASPVRCTGGSCDFNNDGCVDVVDLLKLLGHYDPAGVGCPQ